MDKDLKEFIYSKKLLVLATIDKNSKPWIANVYFTSDNKCNLYYVSEKNTTHSKHIKINSQVSFSIPWYDENNLSNRKAIQGTGLCYEIEKEEEIKKAIEIITAKYEGFKSFLKLKDIIEDKIESRIYKITPNYIKFWNDELFGEEKVKKYKF